MKPYLRSENPTSYEKIPEATAFEAGYLITKNAAWRSVTPVIDENQCKGCLKCYLYCPDGVIFKSKTAKNVAIDYDFCKGCGICAKICPFSAIKMEAQI